MEAITKTKKVVNICVDIFIFIFWVYIFYTMLNEVYIITGFIFTLIMGIIYFIATLFLIAMLITKHRLLEKK